MEPDDDMLALSADEAFRDDLHGALCALALGELHGDEARALEARIASEPALAAQAAEVRATIALVRTSLGSPAALPAAHMERVLSGARAHAAPETPIFDLAWYRRPVVRLAASLVLCAGAGFVGLRLMQTPADEGGSHDSRQLGRRDATASGPADALGDAGVPRVEQTNERRGGIAMSEAPPAWVSVVPGAKEETKKRESAGAPVSLAIVGAPELLDKEVSQNSRAIGGSVDPLGITGLERGASDAKTTVEEQTRGLEELAAHGYTGANGVDGLNAAGQPSAGFFFEGGAAGQTGGGSGGTGSVLTAQSKPGNEGAGAELHFGATPAPEPQNYAFQAPDATVATGPPANDPGQPSSRRLAVDLYQPGQAPLEQRGESGSDGGRLGGQAVHVDPAGAVTANGGFNPESLRSGPSSPGPTGGAAPGAPPASPARAASVGAGVPEQAPPPEDAFAKTREKSAAGEPVSQPTDAGRPVDMPELKLAQDDLETRLREYRDDAPNGNPRLTDEQLTRVVEQEWQRMHAECQRYPNERPRDMYFRFWGDNAFVRTGEDAQSTFGADVDTASYALARRYLREGRAPERAQIRTEEFVNAFTPDLAPPTEETFGLHVELAPTPFGEDANHWLVRVGVRGKELAKGERQPLNLTFVVDTSGSMREQNRLELVKHAMRLLVTQLDARDTIAIVAYANDARQILAPTSAAHRDLIESAIHPLSPNGSTNAEAGLRMGYALAETTLAPGGHSRIVFLSDGVANMGQTDQDRINDDVKRFRDAGIYLNTIGVGMNNHNDAFLEQLANKGDGICDYVDDGAAAEKAIVERFTGAFLPIASDVKLQVEFDPAQVLRWRQLGYENRAIADQDFRNDKIDAGEVGAGHQVTCLYEVEKLADGLDKLDPAKALATLRVRWKAPKGARQGPNEIDVFEREATLSYGAAAGSFRAASPGFRRSALAAQLAEFLRRSSHARMDDYARLVGEVGALIEASPRMTGQGVGAATSSPAEELAELADLVRRADGLGFGQRPPVTDLERTLDEYRRYQYLRATLQELRSEGDPLLLQFEDMNRTLEQQIRDLLRRDLQQRRG